MTNPNPQYFTLGNLGSQQLLLDFQGPTIVNDAGLLAVRALEKPLRIIAGLAERLPDPRSPLFLHHSAETLLTQQGYALLAGYPDSNDHNDLRHDALVQILADQRPDDNHPLASGSTLARFAYAFTRRQAEIPREERPVLLEVRAAQTQRLKVTNDYLGELFVRTRRSPPTEVILDVDATDDPTHGNQALSGYHGYYRQHQYYPLHVYEGHSGFPLAVWLRPGTASASLGAVDILRAIVQRLRAAWPEVRILVRADNGLGTPEVYEFCETQGLDYVIGYASNAVLERATAPALADVELYHHFYGHREPAVQRFEEIRGYQAESWPYPRRIIAKVEVTPSGSQRRFAVTNLVGRPSDLYRAVYVQRGAVPEQPIGEMKNGLRCDRLSSQGFCANSFRLVVHALAYAIVVLFREACASVVEVAVASVESLRQRLWKAGAVVVTSVRRVCLQVSASWPYRQVWQQSYAAVGRFVSWWESATRPPGASSSGVVM